MAPERSANEKNLCRRQSDVRNLTLMPVQSQGGAFKSLPTVMPVTDTQRL
jgi:hypothetical protein